MRIGIPLVVLALAAVARFAPATPVDTFAPPPMGPDSRFAIRMRPDNLGGPGELLVDGFLSVGVPDAHDNDVEVRLRVSDAAGAVAHEEVLDHGIVHGATTKRSTRYSRSIPLDPGMYRVEMNLINMGTLDDGTPNPVEGASHKAWYSVR